MPEFKEKETAPLVVNNPGDYISALARTRLDLNSEKLQRALEADIVGSPAQLASTLDKVEGREVVLDYLSTDGKRVRISSDREYPPDSKFGRVSHLLEAAARYKVLGSEEAVPEQVKLAGWQLSRGIKDFEKEAERIASGRTIQGKKIEVAKKVAVLSLALAACQPIVNPGNQESSSSRAVPTPAISPDLLSRPETQTHEVEDIVVFDAQDRSLWELSNEDLSMIGTPTGAFEGWVDKNSVPWAGEGRDNPDVRFGRWINAGGFGIIRFERNDNALISPDGIIIDSSDSSAWQITAEDRELVGNTPGHFDGWIPDESITEEEKQKGVRWGLWSNDGGRGRIRFEEALVETS